MASAIVRSVRLRQLLHRPPRSSRSAGHEIERYWDRRDHRFTVEVLPGQSYIAEDDELLTTVVGSGCCFCVRHRQSHVTAMASLLLDHGAGSLRCIGRSVACLEQLTEGVFDASDTDGREHIEAWVVVGGDISTLEHHAQDIQLGLVTTILLDFAAPVVELRLAGRRPLSASFEPRTGSLTLAELRSPSIIDMRRDLERIAKLQQDQQRYEYGADDGAGALVMAH